MCGRHKNFGLKSRLDIGAGCAPNGDKAGGQIRTVHHGDALGHGNAAVVRHPHSAAVVPGQPHGRAAGGAQAAGHGE